MIDIRDVLFWIFLILGMILLVWNVFGNSPSEFIALVALIFTVLLKMSSMAERQIKNEIGLRNLGNSFIKLARDFKEHVKHK